MNLNNFIALLYTKVAQSITNNTYLII